MTKKSFRLYFKSNDKHNIIKTIQGLEEIFENTSKMIISDIPNNTLTLLSIGEVKLNKGLERYFEVNPKNVELFIEQFKIEKFN